MHKTWVRYAITLSALLCIGIAMSYSTEDCARAQDLVRAGIVAPQTNCGDFSLDRTIYRQEVAALAIRLAETCGTIDDVPAQGQYTCQYIFADVGISSPNTWACRAVEVLAEKSIITTSRHNSLGRSIFYPLQNITRAESLAIITKSAGGEFQGTPYDERNFVGTGAVSWQKPLMQYADENDIISSIASFGPNSDALRREVFSYAEKTLEKCRYHDIKTITPVSEVFRRVVIGRIYHQKKWTLGTDQNIDGVIDALMQLNPTYVSGLLRFDENVLPTQEQIADYNTLRARIKAKNPHTKFDLVLNAQHYRTVKQMTDRLEYLNSAFGEGNGPDIWYFDFYQNAYSKETDKDGEILDATPEVIDAAIQWAHDHGQLIGGNTWGSKLPPGSDFAGVDDDENFNFNLNAVATLRQSGFQVIMHINNNPQNPSPDSDQFSGVAIEPESVSCQFMHGTTEERKTYIEELAQNQTEGDYRLMYPVFFPTCPVGNSYDSTKDGDMLTTILNFMNTYN